MSNHNPPLILGKKEFCYDLAVFLRDRINERYAYERTLNPDLPDIVVVKNIRNFDDINIPLSEFPLLKVYRTTDTFKGGTLLDNARAAITYSVSYPNLETLPDLLYWMGKQINFLMHEYNKSHKHLFPTKIFNQTYTAQYALMANDLSQSVYPFLRFDIGFEDLYQNEDF